MTFPQEQAHAFSHQYAAVLLDQSNETSWVVPALKSASHYLSQSTVYHRSDSSADANSSCCNRSDATEVLKCMRCQRYSGVLEVFKIFG